MPTAPARPLTHAATLAHFLPPNAGLVGCEVGAGGKPLPGLVPPAIQVDCFKSFGPDTCTADYYGHACALPFLDHALDYVLASHVLEHVANPVAALAEWYRVVRPGGIIYLVVPNRRAAWDRTRELTTVDHLLDDWVRGTTALDPTHVDEFAANVDVEFFGPDLATEDIAARRDELARGLHHAIERGEDINIHFHTFEPANVRELLETLARPSLPAGSNPSPVTEPSLSARPLPRLHWELLELIDGFPAASPNGVLAILRVHKGWRARADAAALRLRSQGDFRALLQPGAEPFAVWAARTPGLGGVR